MMQDFGLRAATTAADRCRETAKCIWLIALVQSWKV